MNMNDNTVNKNLGVLHNFASSSTHYIISWGEAMNNVVLVTGASSGFGYEIFNYLKEKGITAYGVARSLEDSEDLRTFKLDVTHFEKAKEVVKRIVDINGHIDALVNVAGFGVSGAVEDTPIDAIIRQMDVNF